MKTYITTAAVVALCAGAYPSIAQNKQHSNEKTENKIEETVVIRKNNTGSTTVEIKDGEVYVNGEKMGGSSRHDVNSNKKIIIENGRGGSHMQLFEDDDTDMPFARKAMLGIYTRSNEDMNGAEIDMVSPNSGADKAGLRKGDVITRIDDIGIKDSKQLTELIAKHDAGDKVAITYERKGKTLNTEATLSDVPKPSMARVYKFGPEFKDVDIPNPMVRPFALDIINEAAEATPKMGATVEDMADGNGVRVLSARPGSPAANAGLQKDDVIKSLNGETILSVDDLQGAIRGSKRNEAIKLGYERKGATKNTTITFPKTTRKKDL